MKTIIEIKANGNGNESIILKGIYQTKNGYEWLTATRSGECKKLSTARKAVGI